MRIIDDLISKQRLVPEFALFRVFWLIYDGIPSLPLVQVDDKLHKCYIT